VRQSSDVPGVREKGAIVGGPGVKREKEESLSARTEYRKEEWLALGCRVFRRGVEE
jgi:hypothetical protein